MSKKLKDSIRRLIFGINNSTNAINLKNAKTLKTDIVEADFFLGCCAECAKYRGRWFSISGKDRRFPQMPKDYSCTCQGIDFHPVILGISKPMYCPKKTNIVEYSNRPFIDNRTKSEKETHLHYLDSIIFERIKEKDKFDYSKLTNKLPDDTPKSFSAYRRIRIGQTEKFHALENKAKEIGINLDISLEELEATKRYMEYEKKLKESK